MIAIENLKYSYPNSDFHLSIENLSIQQGKKTAVIGPSGFGKTTMLNLIAGILQPDEGTISISNNKLDKLSDDERRDYRLLNIGFVFQDFKLLEDRDVFRNVSFALEVVGAKSKTIKRWLRLRHVMTGEVFVAVHGGRTEKFRG